MQKNTQPAVFKDATREFAGRIGRGTLVDINDKGRAIVQMLGGQESFEADSAVEFASRQHAEHAIGRQVVLLCSNCASEPALIIGVIRDTLWDIAADKDDGRAASNSVEIKELGDRIELEGRREVVLKSGKSRIQLKKDGTVVIQGEKITSRARSRHKIKGASVNIN